jgi:hypothetical protein
MLEPFEQPRFAPLETLEPHLLQSGANRLRVRRKSVRGKDAGPVAPHVVSLEPAARVVAIVGIAIVKPVHRCDRLEVRGTVGCELTCRVPAVGGAEGSDRARAPILYRQPFAGLVGVLLFLARVLVDAVTRRVARAPTVDADAHVAVGGEIAMSGGRGESEVVLSVREALDDGGEPAVSLRHGVVGGEPRAVSQRDPYVSDHAHPGAGRVRAVVRP